MAVARCGGRSQTNYEQQLARVTLALRWRKATTRAESGLHIIITISFISLNELNVLCTVFPVTVM